MLNYRKNEYWVSMVSWVRYLNSQVGQPNESRFFWSYYSTCTNHFVKFVHGNFASTMRKNEEGMQHFILMACLSDKNIERNWCFLRKLFLKYQILRCDIWYANFQLRELGRLFIRFVTYFTRLFTSFHWKRVKRKLCTSPSLIRTLYPTECSMYQISPQS